ncbi:MAG: DsrE family protein [Candidatus Thorarchaeota archaeon]
MVESIVIICEDSPFGKNSAIESIRMAAGILAVGDIEDCKIIFMGDAIYFFSKNLNPEALNIDPFTSILRLLELSGLEIFIHDEALEIAGLDQSDLISIDTMNIISIKEISQILQEADVCFHY